MDWKECKEKKLVKETPIDEHLISSLIKMSENKKKVSDMLELNRETSSSKISLSYDSMREILEAIAIKNGLKIYNHECFRCFLKEVLNEIDDSEKFNGSRIIRNNIDYYGKEIPLSQAELILKDIDYLRNKFFKKYLVK